MINIRELTHQTLINTTLIREVAVGGIVQNNVLRERPKTTPFLIHKLGLERPRDVYPASSGTVQVWAYDVAGDYGLVDQLLQLARVSLEAIEPYDEFYGFSYIDTSGDFYDGSWAVITRYIRLQYTLSGRVE